MIELWKKINAFFHGVTLRNWGFPWHLYLAALVTIASAAGLKFAGVNGDNAALYGFVIANLIGVVNEGLQRQVNRGEIFEDLLANFIGSLFQYILILGVLYAGA